MRFMKKCLPEPEAANNVCYGMRLVRTTSFGRKRVALSNICVDFDDDGGDCDCLPTAPPKRRCFRDSFAGAGKSSLEDLPQEILIRIVCGVEHVDLKSLLLMSKTVRDATLIAKQTHFAYSTPTKMVKLGNNGVKTPAAPKQPRAPRRSSSAKKLAGISVSLFASDNKNLFQPVLLEIGINLLKLSFNC